MCVVDAARNRAKEEQAEFIRLYEAIEKNFGNSESAAEVNDKIEQMWNFLRQEFPKVLQVQIAQAISAYTAQAA